ncbi:hypothetical protein ZWY2020_024377 [Hordeum vulgare]|nr:hypothetical protein ZWY2020_024377 [Hordeum vulgare]
MLVPSCPWPEQSRAKHAVPQCVRGCARSVGSAMAAGAARAFQPLPAAACQLYRRSRVAKASGLAARAERGGRDGRRGDFCVRRQRAECTGRCSVTGASQVPAWLIEGDKYYGAKATINVWQPSIQQGNEFSLPQLLWILGVLWAGLSTALKQDGRLVSSLVALFHVPLSTKFQSDAYQATGCYNLLCFGVHPDKQTR